MIGSVTQCHLILGFDLRNLLSTKTGDRFIHSAQLAEMSIDPKFVELTADVVTIIIKWAQLTSLE